MNVLEAIYKRRSIRAYTAEEVDRSTVEALLQAAIQAPSASNTQPWSFVILQGQEKLKQYSDRAKAHLLKTMEPASLERFRDRLEDPEYSIFYGVGTLIVICTRSDGKYAVGDCCFAAQNLMLAAYDLGLGTCAIGLSHSWLSLPEVKEELGIAKEYQPVLPLIVGHPAGEVSPTPRQDPEILVWR